MSIPPQEVKESYSHDEVQHLIAREWAKQEIIRLGNGQAELQRHLIEITGASNVELKGLREMLTSLPLTVSSQIAQCRKDLRKEIEDDFPNKLENLRMEQRIENKIDSTDTVLGKQISDLDKKVDSTKADLTADITALRVVVDKQWLKIGTIVTTIVAIGGIVQWFFTVGFH